MTKTSPSSVSLGCRLNAYESERMAGLAQNAGHSQVVVVNTCAVTGEAVRQSRQAIRKAKKANPDADIVATGCAVQLDPQGFENMPEVTSVLGNAEKLQPQAWAKLAPVQDVFAAKNLPKGPAPLEPVQARAHLEVQNGCDHRCTFCIIPFGRGQARSKMVQDIVEEAQILVDRGAKEIVLTGVDLTSYGPDLGSSVSLSDPISALLKALPPFIRLRLSSIDGAEVDDQLFSLIVNEARIAPHLHLSLQAGDNMILKRMKRRHTREEAIALCQRLKAQRPEIVFGADIIAGFPTETEAMFQNSLNLVAECELTFLHVFPYSPRTGTPAALMPQVERAVIKDRATRLRQLADDRLAQHLHSKLCQTDEMLVEQVKNGQVFGRLADFTEVVTQGPFTAGDVFLIHPTEIDGHRLRAHPV